MIDSLVGIESAIGMKIYVPKTKVMKIARKEQGAQTTGYTLKIKHLKE